MSETRHDAEREPTGDRPLSEMRLRPGRAPVTRLSRKVLLLLGSVAAVAIGGALLFALRPSPHAAKAELYNTDPRAAPEALARLPKDYAGFGLSEVGSGVPKLGPPLPGDLGRPILAAGAPSPPMGAAGADSVEASGTATAQDQARQQIAQEHDAARTSHLFAEASSGGTGATAALPAISPASLSVAEIGAAASSPVGGTPTTDHNAKTDFLNASPEHRTVSTERLEAPASPDVIQAGAVIPAALITGLRSDLPGEVTAQVTQDVFDSPDRQAPAHPSGRTPHRPVRRSGHLRPVPAPSWCGTG